MLNSSRHESHFTRCTSVPGTEHQADPAWLEGNLARAIRGYTLRCAARSDARGDDCATDGEWSLQGDEVFCRAIPDGTLARVRQGSTWVLFFEWNDGYGRRLLARGPREYVERYALDVAVHGPPGGPEFRGQGTEWRRIGGDDTLHALTVGGEFRLMPLAGGQHLLLFAGNDLGVSVLGLGEEAELRNSAELRLQQSRTRALQVGLGNERIPLRGVGAAGVIGCIDMFDGARLLLAHLTGELFGLFFVRGESGECIGRYDFAALRRGDLQQVLGWMGPRNDGAEGEHEADAELHIQATRKQRARTHVTPSPRQPSARPIARTSLTAADLQLIDRHLTPDSTLKGPGATLVPKLLEGLRTLARLGLPNQILRVGEVRALLEAKAGIACVCCSKTLTRALAAVAAHTQLLRPVGKRWSIRFGDLALADSELMRWIAAISVEKANVADPSSQSPAAAPPPAEHAATSLEPEAREASPAGSITDARDLPPSADNAMPWSDQSEYEDLAGHRPAQAHQNLPVRSAFVRRLRRDGLLRVTMASVPLEESASRWQPGKKGRGPP